LRVRRLASGQRTERILEVDPERSGNFVLRCYLETTAGEKHSQLIGQRRISINVPPPDPSSISINIGDIKTNQGDNAGLGDEGDVHIGNLVDLGKLRTLNDLINLKLDDVFNPLTLESDGEQTISGFGMFSESIDPAPKNGLQIPKIFCGYVQGATKLILEPVQDGAANGGSVRAIHLVASPEFRIGRTRAAVDYLSWFWPRNAENDERTRRISQNVHLRAALEGERILLFDGKTTNGSLFDGQAISDEAGYELQQRGTATLGNEYEIDIAPFETGLSEPLSIQNETLWPGPPPVAPSRQGSVRFEPVNTEPALHDALWIFTDATFGSSHLNPLPLSLPGKIEIQGRIHYYRGQFWVESFAAPGGPIRVNDYLLQPGDIVPLTEGQRVKLGETEFSVSVAS